MQGADMGIPVSTTFAIGFLGFSEGTVIIATPSIPEPGTLFLLATGLAGIITKAPRRRSRSAKS
jgi:hypothetical protein